MATMKEVNEVTNALLGGGRHRNLSGEQATLIVARMNTLGDAICKEQGCNPNEVTALPDETVLGPEAEAAFRAFRELLPN